MEPLSLSLEKKSNFDQVFKSRILRFATVKQTDRSVLAFDHTVSGRRARRIVVNVRFSHYVYTRQSGGNGQKQSAI